MEPTPPTPEVRVLFNEENDNCSSVTIDTALRIANEVSAVSTNPGEAILRLNPDLNFRAEKCCVLKRQEIQHHLAVVNAGRKVERSSYILQSHNVCIEFMASLNPMNDNFWLRRIYSVTTSAKFLQACGGGT